MSNLFASISYIHQRRKSQTTTGPIGKNVPQRCSARLGKNSQNLQGLRAGMPMTTIDDVQWIGLRENLQETMVFTIKYRGFL